MTLKHTIIVATMGHPGSLRPVIYRLPGREEELCFCSRGSIIPTAVKRLERGETIRGLLVVTPHSLQTNIDELRSDEEKKQWGRGAASMVKSHLEGDIARVSEQLSEMGRDDLAVELEKIGKRLFVEVVQGIGTFLDSKHIPPKIVRFRGKQSHLFYAVFKRLNDMLSSGESVRLVVDATHGWNFLSVLTLLSVSAFTKAWQGASLEVEISEPVTKATMVCGGDTSGGSQSKGAAGDLKPEDPVPLSLLQVADISRAISAVEAISRAMSLDYRPLEEIILRGSDIWPDYVIEILREVVRAICGLSSGVSVYSYHHLTKLDEMLRLYSLKISETAEWLAYHVEEDENGGEVVVRYINEAPEVERVVLMSVQRMMSELGVGSEGGSLRPPTGFKLGKMPLSYLRNLLKFYTEKGLLLQQKSLEAELYHLRGWDQELQNILSYSKAPGGGMGGQKVAKYLNSLNEGDWTKLRELEDLPLYSLFCACSSILENSLSLGDPELIREELERRIADIISGQTSGCGSWVHIMRAAWLLSKYGEDALKNGMISEEDIVGMQRNLVAHSGIQHFSIRNITIERTGEWKELILLYDSDFLDAWDAALGGLCSLRTPV